MTSPITKNMLQTVRSIATNFTGPEDDFAAVAMLSTADGATLFPMFQYMHDDETKELLGSVILPRIIKDLQADSVVTVLSAWILQMQTQEDINEYYDNDEPRPSEHPNRVEVLYVNELTADGMQASYMGYIGRDPFGVSPPTLSEMIEVTLGSATGRFVGPLIDALVEVRSQ